MIGLGSKGKGSDQWVIEGPYKGGKVQNSDRQFGRQFKEDSSFRSEMLDQ